MIRHFETAQWVPYPVELVFAFFANPQNMPHIMPPEMKVRIEDMRLQPPPARPVAQDPSRRFQSMAAGEGSEFHFTFVAIPWMPRVRWNSRIVDFVWNDHFVDIQVRGPFAQYSHRHGIVAEMRDGVEGTLVTDGIDYMLPASTLGTLATRRVWQQLEQSFAFRHRRLLEILAIAARQAVQRQ